MIHEKDLRIHRYIVDAINTLCEARTCGDTDELLYDNEVVFDNGMRVAIQAWGEREGPAWTQGVLFDDVGNELSFTEVNDQLDGKYCIGDRDDQYIVNVVAYS